MCTDFILPLAGGRPVISGRTVDFPIKLDTYLEKVPVGKQFKANAPVKPDPKLVEDLNEGTEEERENIRKKICGEILEKGFEQGYNWSSQYGFVAFPVTFPIEWLQPPKASPIDDERAPGTFPLYTDGMNTEGFSAAALYSHYSHYFVPEVDDKTTYLDEGNVVNYLLSTCKTVVDVKKNMDKVDLWTLQDLPLHFSFHDCNNDSLVLEFSDGEMKYYENNEIGVLANGPTYDWLTVYFNYFFNGLRADSSIEKDQYVHLVKQDRSVANSSYYVKGRFHVAGCGMFGLPGDSSSPSRFVRVGKLREYVSNTCEEGIEPQQAGVQYALQLLGRISVCQNEVLVGPYPDYTQWMLVRDHNNKILYFYTNMNHNIQAIKLDECDFSKGEKKIKLPETGWCIDSTSTLI